MKKVFLSHSSKDAEFVMSVCNELENNGLSCWIAPRDIEYGANWAESIAKGLFEDTGLFVFFLSENSNNSKQVVREINLAINLEIPILVFSSIDQELQNLALKYYLSTIQHCRLEAFNNAYMLEVINKIQNAVDASKATGKYGKNNNSQQNIDHMLDEKISAIMEARDKSDNENNCISVSRQKLINIMAKNIFLPCDTVMGEDFTEEDRKELKIAEDLWDDNCSNQYSTHGKHFSVNTRAGAEMYVYEILYKIDVKSLQKWFYIERLPYAEDVLEDMDGIQRTFFVDNPKAKGNYLLFLTFVNDKCICFKQEYFLTEDNLRCLQNRAEVHTYNEPTSHSEKVIFDADEYSNNVLVNPITGCPIEKKFSSDGKYTMELERGAVYMAMKIISEVKVDCFEIGYGYFFGCNGLKQNWMKAAECFMQSDDPWAFFYLGQIFELDPLLKDTEMSKHYFDLAEENGVIENHHAYIR